VQRCLTPCDIQISTGKEPVLAQHQAPTHRPSTTVVTVQIALSASVRCLPAHVPSRVSCPCRHLRAYHPHKQSSKTQPVCSTYNIEPAARQSRSYSTSPNYVANTFNFRNQSRWVTKIPFTWPSSPSRLSATRVSHRGGGRRVREAHDS
jgi:hypothetical protein